MISPEESLRLRESTAALCVFTLVQAMDHHKAKLYEPLPTSTDDASSTSSSFPKPPRVFTKNAIPILRLIIRICTQWPPSSSSNNNNMSTQSLLESLSLLAPQQQQQPTVSNNS